MMSRIRNGPTSRNRRQKGLSMPYTLIKTLEVSGVDPLLAEANDILQAVAVAEPGPPLVLPCCNPTCENKCAWTSGQGRPARFCSATCRQQHRVTKRRLEAEVDVLTAAMERVGKGSLFRRRLNSERSKRIFALYRYSDVELPAHEVGAQMGSGG